MSNIQNNLADLGPESETQQITTFVDDVKVASYEKPLPSSVGAWTKMAEDSKLHDIHAILQRPVNVLDGEFNNAFGAAHLYFPDVIFQKSLNVVKKLDYFTYFRANVKIKMVFNATPFMNGKYWMFFTPYDSVSNRGAYVTKLSNNTGFPGIEIDLASNAPVEIKIPYCSPLSHYNLLDAHSNMGELYIVPINPVQTGTSPTVNGATFSVFAWFEDIELAMPTSKPTTVPPAPVEFTIGDDEVTLKAQVGSSEEHAVTSGPPISGVANKVANVASLIGGAVPVLGQWLRPVEWVARAVGGVAEAFGWNKPTNLDKNCLISNVPAKGYTNADGIDMSAKLAAMPDNGLTYDGGIFSTEVDEMDIRYVASKSCIFRSGIEWHVDMPVGQVLHYNAVAPGMAILDNGQYFPTTVAFLSSMFRYWRGAIKYRLAVAKTAFHTGRLRITYHPGVYGDHATNSVIYENAYNWILDLSVASELEFEIPYVANVPWKETYVGAFNELDWRQEKYSPGTITVTILTQLRRASDSVANNCPFNMWVSGGDDISFAIPDFGSYYVTEPDEISILPPLRAQVFNLTSKGVEHNEQVRDTTTDAFPMTRMSFTTAEQLSMGEKITSLRQLIKRFGITSMGMRFPYKSVLTSSYVFPGPMPLNTFDFLYNQLSLDPAYFGHATADRLVRQEVTYPFTRTYTGALNVAPALAAIHYPSRCPLYYISYLYRFYRGGRRYKMVNPTNTEMSLAISGQQAPSTGIGDQYAFTGKASGIDMVNQRSYDPLIVKRDTVIEENGNVLAPVVNTFNAVDATAVFEHYVYPDINGTIEFEVPYYAQTPISVVGEGFLPGDEGPLVRRALVRIRRSEDPFGMDRPAYSYYSDEAFPSSRSSSSDAGGVRNSFGSYTLYEAAADDFSFGYLVGAPCIDRHAV